MFFKCYLLNYTKLKIYYKKGNIKIIKKIFKEIIKNNNSYYLFILYAYWNKKKNKYYDNNKY